MVPYCVQYSFPDSEKEDGAIIILTLKIKGGGGMEAQSGQLSCPRTHRQRFELSTASKTRALSNISLGIIAKVQL